MGNNQGSALSGQDNPGLLRAIRILSGTITNGISRRKVSAAAANDQNKSPGSIKERRSYAKLDQGEGAAEEDTKKQINIGSAQVEGSAGDRKVKGVFKGFSRFLVQLSASRSDSGESSQRKSSQRKSS